ncbi:rho GDP dissociation inhibitor [Dipsacomyces acuminosporus]|nr:rho GDP dissociation inhibitor [Dipsacomyces acuminosporus]
MASNAAIVAVEEEQPKAGPLTRVSGKSWKITKKAANRSMQQKCLNKSFQKRRMEERDHKDVKQAEKELKDEKKAERDENMSHQENDDLLPTETEGYKVGEKKTLNEFKALDANDESLNKWKASLGLSQAANAFPDDPRKVIVKSLVLKAENKVIEMDVSSPAATKALKDRPIVIKEGVTYSFTINFWIQHEVVSGLKFLQVVKRAGVRVDKLEGMCGSYGPKLEPQSKQFPDAEAPSGMLARGKYSVRSKFIDDDSNVHLEWDWTMEIKKDWA